MDPKLWKLLSILLAIMLLFASLILFYVVEPQPTTNTRQA